MLPLQSEPGLAFPGMVALQHQELTWIWEVFGALCMKESQPLVLSHLQGGQCWNWLVGAPGINEAAWCRAGIDASCINCAVFELQLFILSYGVTGRDVSLQHSPGSHRKGSFSQLPSCHSAGTSSLWDGDAQLWLGRENQTPGQK